MVLETALIILERKYDATDTDQGKAFAEFCRLLRETLNKGDDSVPSDAPERAALTDDSPMPFGKHRGVALKSVPLDYWRWLAVQPDPIKHVALREWLEKTHPKLFPSAKPTAGKVPF